MPVPISINDPLAGTSALVDGIQVRTLSVGLASGSSLSGGTQVRGALVDRSGTTPNTSSNQIMAANATRSYLLVVNASAGKMWINFGTAAVASQPSIPLVAGASFVMEAGFVSNQAVHLIGDAASLIYTAKEG